MRMFIYFILFTKSILSYSQITIDVNDGFILKDLQWQNKPSNDIYKDWNIQLVNPYAGINTYQGDTIHLNLIPDSSCSFSRPCSGIITSGFGWRAGTAHVGIDLDLETGDTVVSAFDGIVRVSGWAGGYGNCVIVRHYNGLESLYGHMSKLLVVSGQHVNSGDCIGLGGNTGYSFGSHLHFELRLLGRPIDARDVIDFKTGTVKESILKLSKLEFEKRYGQMAIRNKILKTNFKSKSKHTRSKIKNNKKRKDLRSKKASKNSKSAAKHKSNVKSKKKLKKENTSKSSKQNTLKFSKSKKHSTLNKSKKSSKSHK